MKLEHGHDLIDAEAMTADIVSKWRSTAGKSRIALHVVTSGPTTRAGVLKFIPTNDFSIDPPTDVDALSVPQLSIAAGTNFNQVIEIPDYCAGGIAAWYDHTSGGGATELISVTVVEKD